jgi:hypothetical protein
LRSFSIIEPVTEAWLLQFLATLSSRLAFVANASEIFKDGSRNACNRIFDFMFPKGYRSSSRSYNQDKNNSCIKKNSRLLTLGGTTAVASTMLHGPDPQWHLANLAKLTRRLHHDN